MTPKPHPMVQSERRRRKRSMPKCEAGSHHDRSLLSGVKQAVPSSVSTRTWTLAAETANVRRAGGVCRTVCAIDMSCFAPLNPEKVAATRRLL